MYYYYVRVAKKFICPQETISLRNTFLPQNSYYKYEYCIHGFYISKKQTVSFCLIPLCTEIHMNQVFLDEIHTIEKVHYNVKIILKLLIEV